MDDKFDGIVLTLFWIQHRISAVDYQLADSLCAVFHILYLGRQKV